MALDLTKLQDAVSKVVSLASSHADVSSTVATISAARDAAIADLTQAQKDIDDMASRLIAAATTPAEAAGLAAVAQAVAPEAPVNPIDAALAAMAANAPK
jgi:septal ring factor EnvC (AmiA/AmiB activator)